MRLIEEAGQFSHGEMQAESGVIMLASPAPEYRGPAHHRSECERAKVWSVVPYIVDGVLVTVEMSRHTAGVRGSPAHEFQASRKKKDGTRYRAEDQEGHRWMFVQRSDT